MAWSSRPPPVAAWSCRGDLLSAAYSGTPLPAKLGIKAGADIALINAPELPGLVPLPDGVTVTHRSGPGPYDVVLLFCRDRATLFRRFAPTAAKLTTAGALWVCWPKQAAGVTTDLTEKDVREHGLRAELGAFVDVKVAAVDATWSGLKFVRRLTAR
jgi:hypothetical protein